MFKYFVATFQINTSHIHIVHLLT